MQSVSCVEPRTVSLAGGWGSLVNDVMFQKHHSCMVFITILAQLGEPGLDVATGPAGCPAMTKEYDHIALFPAVHQCRAK